MWGEHIRFMYWHMLRYMLYSRHGWNRYINELFGVKGKTAEVGTVDRFAEIFNACWTYRDLIYNDGVGTTYDAMQPVGQQWSHYDFNDDYDPGSIEFCNLDGAVLATVQFRTPTISMEDRFDMPNSRGDYADRWRGFNPEVLDFNCVAPRMHASIATSGRLSFFRVRRAPNPQVNALSEVDSVLTGTIGLPGSGCDLELATIDVEVGKIIKIKKFQIRLA